MVCFDLVQTPSGSLMPAPRSSARTFFKRSMIGITWKTAGTKIHTTSTAANVIAPICRFQVCVNKSLQVEKRQWSYRWSVLSAHCHRACEA
jgi:hypothetical protein